MEQEIQRIRDNFFQEIQQVQSAKDVEAVRVKYLGRKGPVQQLFKQLGTLNPEDRPRVGKLLNTLRQELETAVKEKQQQFKTREKRERIDLSLPGRKPPVGRKHPLTQTLDEIKAIFTAMGFTVADGPEVETDYYNFEALNIPKNHPSRNMQDTLYITEDILLRTHTSPVQIRTMQSQQPPVRIIAPGRVYRRDTPDASHSPFFHQVEGLCVDHGISFADLKAVISEFARKMFGTDIKVRFRPSFFPFTEPSLEYDFNCVFCRGKGCKVCKYTGWMEISGAGMVDPNVFKAVGYDPETITGYAFGMGVDRIAMLKFGIDDIRLFFENDMRFLTQF
ncbi:MAG TPA: phenylalanine--tRNA ligase subunit alpha [Calditrichae bacterium]|nr:phenylalanine--tRNA ligase subunit alpha [Calditrichia bacterium]